MVPEAKVEIPRPPRQPTGLEGAVRPSTKIAIRERGLQLQFVFFYDLKARIRAPDEPLDASTAEAHGFVRKDVKKWSVTKHFSDSFPHELIVIRFTRDRLAVECMQGFSGGGLELKVTSDELKAADPAAAADLPSYPAVECILFKNGILSVLIRVFNTVTIDDCARRIGHPDFLPLPHLQAEEGPPVSEAASHIRKPGPAVTWAFEAMRALEPHMAEFLNAQGLRAVSFKSGDEKTLELVQGGDGVADPDASTPLHMSRPYVGAIMSEHSVDVSGGELPATPNHPPQASGYPQACTSGPPSEVQSTDRRREALKALAVACARTTPEFLEANTKFEDLRVYLEKGSPPRNIYFPGPSVVLIGRRGWACIHAGQRNPALFQDGVVEPALFALQAVNASARATRGHLVRILENGTKIGHRLNMELTKLMNHEKRNGRSTFRRILGGFTVIQIGAHREMEEAILEYVGFLARARLNSPCDDASCLLDAHFTTHSGIAAVTRVKMLVGLDSLLGAARATMQNYGAFLSTANAHWQAQARRIQTVRIVGSIFIGTPLYAIARIAGAGYALLLAIGLVTVGIPVMLWPTIRGASRWWLLALLVLPALELFVWLHYGYVLRPFLSSTKGGLN